MSFTEQVGNDFLTKPIAERLVVINLIFLKMEINGSDPLLYRVSLSVDPSSGIDLNHFGQIFRRLVRDGVISFRLDDVDHNSLSFSVAIKYI